MMIHQLHSELGGKECEGTLLREIIGCKSTIAWRYHDRISFMCPGLVGQAEVSPTVVRLAPR